MSLWTLEAGAANLRPRKTMPYNLSGGWMAPRNVWRSRPADHTVLTFSLDTWCEKGQDPSVFLHVPRTNLQHGIGRFGEGWCQVLPLTPQVVSKAGQGTWCTRPPSQGHGCKGSARHGYTSRSGCSTCSTLFSSLSSASPAG